MPTTKETLFQRLKAENSPDFQQSKSKLRFSAKVRYGIIFLVILICSLFFSIHMGFVPQRSAEYSLVAGYIWPNQTIKAEFTFPVYKDQNQLDSEMKQARDKAEPVFQFNSQALADAKSLLKKIQNEITETENPSSLSISFTERALGPILRMDQQQRKSALEKIIGEINRSIYPIYSRGLINVSRKSIKTAVISVRVPPNKISYFQTSNLLDTAGFIELTAKAIKGRIDDSLAAIAGEIVLKTMFPNLIYSQELTVLAQELSEKSVPRTSGIVRIGEIIVNKGDRVTQEQINKLISYDNSKFMRSLNRYTLLNYVGSVLHSLLIFGILLLYIYFIRKRIYNDNIQFGIIASVLVFIALQSWLSVQINSILPFEYLLLLPALSMLIAVVFDSRTAFYVTVTMSLLVAGIRGNDYETSTAMLIAGSFAAYSVRDIQSRTQMYQSFFFILIGFTLSILAFGFERSTDLTVMFYRFAVATVNSAISPFLTFGLLFLIERTTNISTDLRIKEFDNLNHPLLIKLSEIAPGTYQHTLSVAAIAERCARAINANPLLVKVGAYFHDIGKVGKPEYFGENQMDKLSKHDQLSPKKSASAIREHVISGIALAKQYRIPERIINFIPMHHGTTLIKHFYAKAIEETKSEPINEADFRYPGPKPDSKETAILMICDTAEALSRLANKDKDELENSIRRIIDERINDGQFDNCDITMKDFNIIIDTCVRNLIGMSHQRVAYKEIRKEENIENEVDKTP